MSGSKDNTSGRPRWPAAAIKAKLDPAALPLWQACWDSYVANENCSARVATEDGFLAHLEILARFVALSNGAPEDLTALVRAITEAKRALAREAQEAAAASSAEAKAKAKAKAELEAQLKAALDTPTSPPETPPEPDDATSPPPQLTATSPPPPRGYRNRDDAIARQVLRERGFGKDPGNELDPWVITDAEVEQLWRIAGEEAHRLEPPGTVTRETKQKRLRAAFNRVTGR